MSTLIPAHVARLIERKLDPHLAQSLGLRSAPDGAILMEYRLRGQVHNVKIRRGKGNMPWQQTGKPLILWNLDCLTAPPVPDEPLVITEGEFDALALLQAGFTRVVSVPNGAPSSPNEQGDKRYSYLYGEGNELLPDIAKFGTVVLAVDGDSKGQYLRDSLAVRIGDDKCFWVQWPAGCKDANDVLMREGMSALQNVVYAAKRMWTDRVARMSDIPPQDEIPLYTLGHEMLDRPVSEGGIRIPQWGFVVVSGPANHGKSTFVRQLLWHLWSRYGSPFGITAFEEDAKPTYEAEFRRLALRKDPKTATIDELGRADIEIERAMVNLLPDADGSITVEELLANIEFAARVYGIRIAFVDPANEIDKDSDPDTTGAMIKALRQLAKRYRMLIIIAAHPPVEIVRKKRKEEIWTLYDIEGGRHWAGKSDAGFMVWRSGESTMLHAAKLKRFHEMGARQLYRMAHDRESNRFNVAEEGFHILDQEASDKAAGVKGNGYTGPRYSAASKGS